MRRLYLLPFLLALMMPIETIAQCPDENHPHMIDLGLPTGTKWACCNVGADKPEDFGGYYSWGETEVKNCYDYENYKFFTSWSDWQYYQNIGRDISRTKYDVAYTKWGDSWQMPKKEQIEELINNCTSEWTTQNGVIGMVFTGTNDNSIFLPASDSRWSTNTPEVGTKGCYWSSELNNTDSTTPWKLEFTSDGAKITNNTERCSGILVRPVTPKIHSGYISVKGGWVERITNGNLEGDNYYSFGYNTTLQIPQADQIVVDPDDATNHCLKMVKSNEYGYPDFHIKIYRNASNLYPGQKYRFSMRVKASKATKIQSQGLTNYGGLLDDEMTEAFDVTPEWTTINYSGIVTDSQAGLGILSFVFSDPSPVEYYFDDLSFEVMMGDTFTAICEGGSELIFSVISEEERTCAIGDLSRTDGNHRGITDIFVAGTLTLPSAVEYQGNTYSVRFVGEGAFAENTQFYNVIIPEGVTYLGGSAFWISQLKSVSIPSTVKGFGHQVFSMNRNLESVFCYIQEPFAIDEALFSNGGEFTTATLYVPVGTKALYETTDCWNKFKTILEMVSTVDVPIGQAGETTFCSDYNLDFSKTEEAKAYVATGYDKTTGTIWLSRVYDVPANTGFLLIGNPDKYEIPVSLTGSSSYYKNMFKGTLKEMTLQTTDGDYTNYYLSSGKDGVGFYKVTKEEGVKLGKNRAYLPIPTVIEAVGEAGSSVAISVGGAEQVPYFSDQSLDFTEMEAKGMKAYTATGYDYSTGTIWLSRVKKVPAETGVLIMAPKGDYDVPTASVASVYENMFKGTLEGTTIFTEEDGFINYYLSSGTEGIGFYKVTKEGGVALGANRCYLQIPKVRPASSSRGANASQTANDTYGIGTSDVIGIPLFGSTGGNGDGTTNLRKPVNTIGEPDVYYNLNGQRVDKPTKGLYISKGKKVIVR